MGRLAQLGKAIVLPFAKAGTWYYRTAEKNPLTTGIITTVVKTSAADLFAQKVLEKRENVDWKRHNMFCTFGFFYLGGFQYYLYNNLFVAWCKHITRVVGHAGSAPVKVFIDQAIHHPLLYFPTFYALKGYVEGRPVESTVQKYKEDLWENLKALWTIWVPAQLVNFALVPRHLRIPFVAAVSFAWTVVISMMRGALTPTAAEAAAATAAGSLKNSQTELSLAPEIPLVATSSRVPLAFYVSGEHLAERQEPLKDQGLQGLLTEAKT